MSQRFYFLRERKSERNLFYFRVSDFHSLASLGLVIWRANNCLFLVSPALLSPAFSSLLVQLVGLYPPLSYGIHLLPVFLPRRLDNFGRLNNILDVNRHIWQRCWSATSWSVSKHSPGAASAPPTPVTMATANHRSPLSQRYHLQDIPQFLFSFLSASISQDFTHPLHFLYSVCIISLTTLHMKER